MGLRGGGLLQDAVAGIANDLPDWWKRIENDPDFQKYANLGLGTAYTTISLVALVQLIRIQVRVPEYGWTTQKVFHLLNAVVSSTRAVAFFFFPYMVNLDPLMLRLFLYDLPGLLFFTTYTLLVLFWAEIYHQARSMPTSALRPVFIVFNAIVYGLQSMLWVGTALAAPHSQAYEVTRILSAVFLAAVSMCAAAGFMLYGGRLFLMLQRFPIESRGRKKKLREVGMVTAICTLCFTIRAVLVALSAMDEKDLDLDLMDHPLLNVIYYSLAEIVPSGCVLFILRKLPPKREAQGYQQIASGAQS